MLCRYLLAFGGGLLKPSVGEKFDEAGVKLLNHFGATEVGAISTVWVPQKPDYDYQYFRLGRDLDFEVLRGDEKDGQGSRFKLVTYPFGWGGPFEIKDELGCNPQNATTDFSVFGRTDDVIALATGEKVLPNTKTIPRSDKGSVLRQEVYKVFDEEISRMYIDLENVISNAPEHLLDPKNFESGIKRIIQERLNWRIPPSEWTIDHDLFELGMDSLQALQLRRLILSSIRSDKDTSPRIPREFVYWNPSVAKMAKSLRGDIASHTENLIDHFARLYSTELPPSPTSDKFPTLGNVILLTGSTGCLGAHLLEYFANLATVSRIICLNRMGAEGEQLTARERLLRAVKSKGIVLEDSAWEKIEAIQTNLSAPCFGLDEPQYREICHQVTHVLHHAWPMDFNRPLPSFESQFKILQSLIRVGKQAHDYRPTICPKILFVSSIAVVGKCPQVHGEPIVPEMAMQDDSCTDEFGYAQAKLVCEKILESSALSFQGEIETKIVRVGQMTGSSKTGIWNATEHFPALVKSSKLIGALPKLQGTLSWLPVDLAAQLMSELLFQGATTGSGESPSSPQIFHLENPIRQAWADVFDHLRPELSISTGSIIPYAADWLAKVLEVPDEKIDLNPAKKMAEFFQRDFEHMAGGEIIMGTESARKASPCLRSCGAVSGDLIRGYVEGWRAVGFLEA